MTRGIILGPKPAPKESPAFYLPSGYKGHRFTKVTGRADSGEISPKGLVSETEDWEGRVEAVAAPATIRWKWDRTERRFRPMTMQEQIDRRGFIRGMGPAGVRRLREGRST